MWLKKNLAMKMRTVPWAMPASIMNVAKIHFIAPHVRRANGTVIAARETGVPLSTAAMCV
jgi:hypothetical protein